MKALFVDLSERTRRQRTDSRAYLADERTRALALYDAVQVAVAQRQHDQVTVLLKQMHAIVAPALERRRRNRLWISA